MNKKIKIKGNQIITDIESTDFDPDAIQKMFEEKEQLFYSSIEMMKEEIERAREQDRIEFSNGSSIEFTKESDTPIKYNANKIKGRK